MPSSAASRVRFAAFPRLVGHPTRSSFAVALITRASVAITITISFNQPILGDSLRYLTVARTAATEGLAALGTADRELYHQTAAFLWPLTAVMRLTDGSALAGRLMVCCLGATTAALVAHLAGRSLSRSGALAAGLLVALLPSQVFWSSLILKDALVWTLVAGLGLIAAGNPRGDTRLGHRAVGAMGLLLLLITTSRHSAVVAAWALVGAALWPLASRKWLMTTLLLALVTPAVAGMGPGGTHWVMSEANLHEVRAGMARVTAPDACIKPRPPESSFVDEIRRLPQGVSHVLLEPAPWRLNCGLGMTLAAAESAAWYVVLFVALAGLGALLRHPSLRFPVLTGVGTLVIYALAEADLSTAYRHRSELVWVIALLLPHGWQRIRQHRSRKSG